MNLRAKRESLLIRVRLPACSKPNNGPMGKASPGSFFLSHGDTAHLRWHTTDAIAVDLPTTLQEEPTPEEKPTKEKKPTPEKAGMKKKKKKRSSRGRGGKHHHYRLVTVTRAKSGAGQRR